MPRPTSKQRREILDRRKELKSILNNRAWPTSLPPTKQAQHIRLRQEGEAAFKAGLQISDCPYAMDTAEFKNWWRGWSEAPSNKRNKTRPGSLDRFEVAKGLEPRQ